MRSNGQWAGKPSSLVVASLYGALVALVVSYVLSYVLGCFGIGILTSPGRWSGSSTFMRAALNLYVMQHVMLVGSGHIASVLGDKQQISAFINLPLTIWAFIPALALIWSGYISARMRRSTGRWGMVFPAVFGGVIYVIILSGLSFLIKGKIDPSVLPAIKGVEFNPPVFAFHPSLISTIIYTGIFGVIFTYLGALIAIRIAQRETISGKWWACGKAIILFAILVQLLMMAAAGTWLVMEAPAKDSEERAQLRLIQMVPAVAKMGYALIYGSTLSYGVISSAEGLQAESHPLSGKINLYRGIKSDNGAKIIRKQLPVYVFAATIFMAIFVFISGYLAVRWGSRDGSLPTAARITIIHGVYMIILMSLCRFGWGGVMKVGNFSAKTQVIVTPNYNSAMLWIMLGVFVLAFLGAHLANRKFAGRLVGFPSV